jgi:hypothetical protein
MKKAAKQVQLEIQKQVVNKQMKDELRKVAAARAEEQAANRRAAEAAAAEEAEVSKRELEADRQREEQREQRDEERRIEQRDEERRREQREEEKRRERETRKRSEDDRETRKRSEDDRGTEERPEAERAEDRQGEATWDGRHVRDRRMQERLGKRKEERPGRSSGPEGAGLEPGYTIPRKSRPWKTTASHSRSLPSSYKDYGLHHRPPEGRGGEAGVPAAVGQEHAVPGSRSGSGQMQGAALPVPSRRTDPEQ